MANSPRTLQAVEQVETGQPRYVTPGNPLIINEVSATFDEVIIQGGDIQATAITTATFKKLSKQS
jgi:hypothetical protein